MPYTLEDYHRDSAIEYLKSLSAEELFAMLPVEVLVKILPVEERLEGVTKEEIESYLKRLRKRKPRKQTLPRRRRQR
jgi:hypothetical protein